MSAGEKHGRLTVISVNGRMAGCRCECGTEVSVRTDNLKSRNTTSCGCSHATHGKWRHELYSIWNGMKGRCEDPSHKSYPGYGGRGIAICERWHDIGNFVNDMGKRPSSRHTLDRIDNDRGYEPGNVRWATPSEQVRGRRCAKLTESDAIDIRTLRGMGATPRDLAAAYGVDRSLISMVVNGKLWVLSCA